MKQEFIELLKGINRDGFKDFLKNIRLNYSMKLAKCTNMSFTDICYESGFNSSQYYSTLFKLSIISIFSSFVNFDSSPVIR